MAFDSSEPHLLMNEGAEPAVGLWFVLGRRQGTETRVPRISRDKDESATVLRYPGPLV
jgi:hypothetical protein